MSLDVGQLYEQHGEALRAYVCDRMRQAAAPDAEDVYASVWERAVRAAGTYRDCDRPKSWLFTIAHNLMRDYYRATTWRLRSGSVSADALLDQRHPPVVDRYSFEYDDVRAALKSLPRQHAAVLRLRYLEGYPIQDVATGAGLSRDSVKKMTARALDNMRVALTGARRSTSPAGLTKTRRARALSDRDARILALQRKGLTREQIGAEIGISERAVKRALERCRKQQSEGAA